LRLKVPGDLTPEHAPETEKQKAKRREKFRTREEQQVFGKRRFGFS
jgi:hypothetical protein